MAAIRNVLSRNEAPVQETDPFDVQGNVRAAYALLADANKKAIRRRSELQEQQLGSFDQAAGRCYTFT
jgi:hypothetical protein